MAWADWMVVNLTLEEEFKLEREAQAILHHDDADEVASLCSSLVKQTHYQQILLTQAVGRITELETESFNQELNEELEKEIEYERRMSWWQRILSAD